jgi:hypothetical protein
MWRVVSAARVESEYMSLMTVVKLWRPVDVASCRLVRWFDGWLVGWIAVCCMGPWMLVSAAARVESEYMSECC